MHGGLVSRFIHSQKKGAEELNLPRPFSFDAPKDCKTVSVPFGRDFQRDPENGGTEGELTEKTA